MIPLDPETSLRVTRVLQAPRERVFDAFVLPELRHQWWAAQPGDRCTICEIDGRVGGHYRINMIKPEAEFLLTGTFLEFERPEKLVFTWTWVRPTDAVKKSVVTILFKALGPAATELTIIHEGLVSPSLRDMHVEGWNGCLASLAAFVERPADGAKNYQCVVQIKARPERVYEAITTAKGLTGWWTTRAEVGTGEGSESTFHFGRTFNTMRVDRLVPGREVHWTCLAQRHEAAEALKQVDEWVGTRVAFRLVPKDGGTELQFEHVGLVPTMECYEICNAGWNHFLRASLKSFAETGAGQPFEG